jgi:hypothetical protein
MNIFGLTEVILARFFFEGIFPIVFADMCIIFMSRDDGKLVADTAPHNTALEQLSHPRYALHERAEGDEETTHTVRQTPQQNRVEQRSPSYVEAFCRSYAMQYMAKISYAFYAIHYIVLFYIGGLLRVEEEKNPLWTVPVTLGVSLVLGALITRFFEQPLNDAIVRWAGFIRTRRVIIPQASPSKPVPIEMNELKVKVTLTTVEV